MVVENSPVLNNCPECSGLILPVFERGEAVCQSCGLVVRDRMVDISSSGVRAYTHDEKVKKSHTGDPISILTPDIALSTYIDRKKIQNEDLKRATRWNAQLSWEKKNYLRALTELKRISNNLEIPIHVRKTATKLYKKIFKNKLLRGRSIDGMVAASLFITARKARIPLTLSQIIDESKVDPTGVKRCIKIIVSHFNLKTKIVNPRDLIPRYINDLNLGYEIEKFATRIIEKLKNTPIFNGKDPRGICAGVIYLITKSKGMTITQKEICNVIGITEVTLRSRYQELLEMIKISPP